jgi:hypothetical protein
MEENKQPTLFDIILHKGSLKQKIYKNTAEAFSLIRDVVYAKDKFYRENYSAGRQMIPFTITEAGEFELHVQFAGDILIFVMHTNVFEFSRSHEVMQTQYIREDKERSYCGIISIYNFLADSFKYNRVNDVGYMIGRMFVNRDMCYFIEGKRELGMLYPNFGKEKVDLATIDKVVSSAMLYTINFDLLVPPYESLVQVSVGEMKSIIDSYTLKTGKRLGFKFQADKE